MLEPKGKGGRGRWEHLRAGRQSERNDVFGELSKQVWVIVCNTAENGSFSDYRICNV